VKKGGGCVVKKILNYKSLTLIFVIFMLFAILLTGCGSTQTSDTEKTENNSSSSGNEKQEESDKQSETKPVTLKLAHQWAKPVNGEGDYRSVLAEKFAEEVEKASNGEIKIEVYPANSLVKPNEQFTALSKGSLDMAIWAPFYAAGKVPEFSITLMPGIIQSYDQAWEWRDAEVGQHLNNLLETNGVRNLVWAWGTIALGTAGDNKVIHPEDIKGLTFRGAGKDSEKLLESEGASITSMPSSEIYSAFQTNILDGTLTSLDSFMSYRLFEVIDHFNNTGENAFMFAMNPLVIGNHAWDKLSKEQQDILSKASADLQGWVREAATESVEEAANVFRENGVEVHDMTPEESKEWFEASQPVVEEFAASSETAKQLIDAARKLHE
jgi:TRAP-type C4-dicarboxylate transport system substrate-binding protein